MQPLRGLIVILAVLSLAAPGVAAAGSSPYDALVFRSASGKLRVFDSATGPLRTLPAGVVSSDGETALTARVHGGSTLIQRIATRTGAVLADRTIDGAWGFQRAAEDGTLVAGGEQLAPIALVAASRANGYAGSSPTTRIALLPNTLSGPLKVISLHGNYGVDALSPDGLRLYVIQHLAGEHYTVRGYDLRRNKLSVPIVDKREPNEKMQGLPLARASSADGQWELTLYRRPSGVPFVHALMTSSLAAFCIDMPASARMDPSDASSWGVAVHGDELYLANAQNGWVGVIGIGTLDFSRLKVLRSASLGEQVVRSAPARPLAVSPDGATLYLARPDGVVPIATGTLEAGTPLETRSVGSLAIGSGLLYAAGGTTRVFDMRTGAPRAGALRATGGLTLVGVAKP